MPVDNRSSWIFHHFLPVFEFQPCLGRTKTVKVLYCSLLFSYVCVYVCVCVVYLCDCSQALPDQWDPSCRFDRSQPRPVPGSLAKQHRLQYNSETLITTKEPIREIVRKHDVDDRRQTKTAWLNSQSPDHNTQLNDPCGWANAVFRSTCWIDRCTAWAMTPPAVCASVWPAGEDSRSFRASVWPPDLACCSRGRRDRSDLTIRFDHSRRRSGPGSLANINKFLILH